MKRTIGAAFVYPLLITMGCSTSGGGGGPPTYGDGGSGNNGGTGSTGTNNNAGQCTFGCLATGGSAANGTGLIDVDSGCLGQTTPAALTRVNILFLLDKSGSMGDNPPNWSNAATRWNPVVTTLDSFFSDQKSTGLYASLSFLPADGNIGYACKQASYSAGNSSIKVPLTLLDTAGRQTFLSRLCDPANATASTCIKPGGGTPTRPALQGTIDYLLTVQQKYPDSKTVIVFLTDGEPGFGFTYNGAVQALNSCDDLPLLAADNNTPSCAVGSCGGCVDNSALCVTPETEVTRVANVIKNAPAKSIYVFGVGDLSASTMDQWALASGNPAVALQGMTGTQAAATLKAALEGIRSTSLPCNMPIPASTGAVDYSRVNVDYVDGASKVTRLGKSQGCTSAQPSWQYDDQLKPTIIQLCPNACNLAQQDAAGKVQVVFGCATLIF